MDGAPLDGVLPFPKNFSLLVSDGFCPYPLNSVLYV